MYASTPTKLPLATFARNLGLHPLHFAQVFFKPATTQTTRSATCDRVLPQYEWQDSDAVSREEVARAIAEAEEEIERELGHRLLPSWEREEWQPTARFYRPELYTFGYSDLRGLPQSVKARWGHVVSGGVKATTALQLAAPIVYTDADGDGYFETATVTVAGISSAVAACEVRAFYPGHAADPAYEIRPVAVSIAVGIATIVFRRENAVAEAQQEALESEEVVGGGLAPAGFLTTVDVYRVWNDPQTQATLMWHQQTGVCDCGSTACEVCQFEVQSACLNVRMTPADGFLSYVPATWNATTGVFDSATLAKTRIPDAVRLFYYAGLQDQNLDCPRRDMDRAWGRAVSAFACARLDRPPCGCVVEIWERWRQDLAFSGGADELATYNLNARDLESPFGTRRGELEAWRRVRQWNQGLARVAFAP